MVAKAGAIVGESTPGAETGRPLTLARWLFAVAALVVLMIVVGGMTRLTDSGLSIEPVATA